MNKRLLISGLLLIGLLSVSAQTNESAMLRTDNTSYSLEQNVPNPFNDNTRFNFSIGKPERVTITLYNMLGKPVDQVFDGMLTAGSHVVEYEASALPKGVYLCVMQAGNFKETKRIIVAR